ncbi:MAG: DUF1572 family protein, partial [Pirellulales bacterium]|nr:DUF1572 family protein [Pirellulales bacterium]
QQWIISGLGELPDTRNRPAEFSQRGGISAEELIEQLRRCGQQVQQTLQSASEDSLLRRRNIQGFEVTGIQAAIDSIAHFRGHTQEITHLTRVQLGDDYQFDFVPDPNQQGGAAE